MLSFRHIIVTLFATLRLSAIIAAFIFTPPFTPLPLMIDIFGLSSITFSPLPLLPAAYGCFFFFFILRAALPFSSHAAAGFLHFFAITAAGFLMAFHDSFRRPLAAAC
jgi:hypothetical protein